MAAKQGSKEQTQSNVDAIMQVGDLPYLRHYLGQLGYKNLSSRSAKQLVPTGNDQVLEMLCKHGHVDMLKYL